MLRIFVTAVLVILTISTILNWRFMRAGVTVLLSMSGSNAAVGLKQTVGMSDGFAVYVDEVLGTYQQIPDDIRNDMESEEYRAYFEPFERSAFYKKLNNVLENENDQFNYVTKDVYLAMYDRDRMTIVYLLDPRDSEKERNCKVGEWESVEQEEIDAFFKGPEDTLMYRNSSDHYGELITIADPITNDAGEIIAFAMSDIPLAFVNAASLVFTILYAAVLTIVIVIVILVIRMVMQRRLVKPIREVSSAAEQYAISRADSGVEKNFFSRLNIQTGDELEELSQVMADMEQEIAVYEDNLTKAAAEEERIQTELGLATAIQIGMLPQIFPPYPERKEFDIYAVMDPAKEVGGDFYDFFLIDDTHLGLVMADVSGKGIPAALFMMSSMIVINNLASEGYSPAEVLRRANEKICSSAKVDMFVTVWFGILDLRTGVVTSANAGHEYPAVRHAGGQYELLRTKHSFVIGGMDGMKYREESFTLEPGSSLFLYTDGVAEATNAQEQFYGYERMLAALNTTEGMSAEETLRTVREDVDRFVEEAPQFDDLTMMCITYKGC